MKSTQFTTKFISLLLFLSPTVLSAQPVRLVKIKPNGRVQQVTVAPGEALTSKLVIGYEIASNTSAAVNLYLSTPEGTNGRLLGGKGKLTANMKTVGRARAAAAVSQVGGSSSEMQEQQTRFFASRDACSSKRTKNFVQLTFDFSDLSEDMINKGFPIKIAVKEDQWQGSRAASLKPESDGKFAPQPLLLMTSLAALTGGSDQIQLSRWGKTQRNKAAVRIEDYVMWRGQFLTRSVIGNYLSGGKATVEITDGYNIYSGCLEMVRRRQNINGYAD